MKEKDLESSIEAILEEARVELNKTIARFVEEGKCPDSHKVCVMQHALAQLLAVYIMVCANPLLKDSEVSKKFGIKTREDAIKYLISKSIESINTTIDLIKNNGNREGKISLEI